jgi:hypothetical protein
MQNYILEQDISPALFAELGGKTNRATGKCRLPIYEQSFEDKTKEILLDGFGKAPVKMHQILRL